MGHRANFILRRGGRTQRYYSPWGALSLTQDIFWGPDETTRFIRSLSPEDDSPDLDSPVAAALVDWDTRRLLWFEAEHLRPERRERRLYFQLLRQTWADWEIRFARDGDFADRLFADDLFADEDAGPSGTAFPGSLVDEWFEGDGAYDEVGEDEREYEYEHEHDSGAESRDGWPDERSCLVSLIHRLLDPTRFDPQVMLAGARRASLEASIGCGCLTALVTLTAIGLAAWVRTAPVITACAMVILAVLFFFVRVRRRTASLVTIAGDLEAAPQAAGPSLLKKRSILDAALGRLGYPTTEQLEQAGELTFAADDRLVPDALPDRFGPLRALRADEVSGVGFYQLHLNRLRFRELRRGTPLWRACLIKLLTRFGWDSSPMIPVPRPQRLIFLRAEDLPPHVRHELQPWMQQAADSGFAAEFFYTVPTLGRQEAFSAVLSASQGLLLASFLYARIRLRVAGDDPDEEESCDEEMFEASLLSVLHNGRLLITGTRPAELDPLPGQEIQTWEDADWPTLLAIHQRRLAALDPSELRPLAPAELPSLVLQWNQREIDHHVARGVYQRMTREDLDRYAEEG